MVADDMVLHILEVAIIIWHAFIDIRILLDISIMNMLKISSIINNIKMITLKMNMYMVIEITEYLKIVFEVPRYNNFHNKNFFNSSSNNTSNNATNSNAENQQNQTQNTAQNQNASKNQKANENTR